MYRKSVNTKKLEAKRRRCVAMRAAKERKRMAESDSMVDFGGFITDGILGKHTVRLLAYPGDELAMAVVVDGEHRRPRSFRGVLRCMARMVEMKTIKETTTALSREQQEK